MLWRSTTDTFKLTVPFTAGMMKKCLKALGPPHESRPRSMTQQTPTNPALVDRIFHSHTRHHIYNSRQVLSGQITRHTALTTILVFAWFKHTLEHSNVQKKAATGTGRRCISEDLSRWNKELLASVGSLGPALLGLGLRLSLGLGRSPSPALPQTLTRHVAHNLHSHH